MIGKKLKRILYAFAVLMLLLMSLLVWRQSSDGVIEEQTFTINGKQSDTFVYNMKTEYPRILQVKVGGILDCDAILIIKEVGEGNGVRMRRSFLLKAGELKDRDFATEWPYPGMIIEFRANDCIVNNLTIKIGIEK